ncbi:uncharacterized protein TNCV_775781 [Trichonephila clavipes]|nr:uncharacterized protein TNCV_775781 [Trichonephila clavipes]
MKQYYDLGMYGGRWLRLRNCNLSPEQKTSSQQQKALRRQQDQILKQQEHVRQQQRLQEQQVREFSSRLNGDYAAASGKGLPGSVTPRGLMFLPVFEGGLPQVSTPSTLLTTTSGILPPHFPNHLNSSTHTSPSRQLSPLAVTSSSQNNNGAGNSLTKSNIKVSVQSVSERKLYMRNSGVHTAASMSWGTQTTEAPENSNMLRGPQKGHPRNFGY